MRHRMRRRVILLLLVSALASVLLPGCAAVRMRILPEQRAEERQLRREVSLWHTLTQFAAAPAPERAAACLATARDAWPGVLAGDETSTLAYRAALRRYLRLQEQHAWKLPSSAVIVRQGDGVLDPSAADFIVPADQVEIGGVPRRTVEDGLGLPCVAWFRRASPFLAGEPGVPSAGMAIPVTALLTFDSAGEAQLRFIRTLQGQTVPVNGRRRTVAADFSAPLAMMIAKGDNLALDLVGLFLPTDARRKQGLFQFQPYEPGKIPVVFVHGLMSRPEAWRMALNELLADPEIRERYQFWFYLYPTGLPVWKSAAGLREELDRFNRELEPHLRTASDRRHLGSKVLVGHSMGGLISSLQIREGGAPLWGQFSDTPLASFPVSERARQALHRLTYFEPREDVSRVIFAGVPHRGSPAALRPGASFFASRVRYALPEVEFYRATLLGFARENVRRDLAVPANSIRFLREDSPLLLSILNLPRDRSIPVHSIIGDRGRGDSPAGSDGVVPFSSSSFPDVASETIVPSGHSVQSHPDGIAEIARILRENRPR